MVNYKFQDRYLQVFWTHSSSVAKNASNVVVQLLPTFGFSGDIWTLCRRRSEKLQCEAQMEKVFYFVCFACLLLASVNTGQERRE